MTNKNTCCVKCEKHVRDRSFIGSGSSLKSMTGIHCECKNPSCPCHKENMPESFNERFGKRFREIARLADEGNDRGYGKGLARLQIEIGKFVIEERAKAVSEVVNELHRNIEAKWGTKGKMTGSFGYQGIVMDIHAFQTEPDRMRDWILGLLEARSRGESNEKKV